MVQNFSEVGTWSISPETFCDHVLMKFCYWCNLWGKIRDKFFVIEDLFCCSSSKNIEAKTWGKYLNDTFDENVPNPKFWGKGVDIRPFPCRKNKIFIWVKTWMVASSVRRNEIPVVGPVSCCWMVMLWICITPVNQHHAVPYLLWGIASTFIPWKRLPLRYKHNSLGCTTQMSYQQKLLQTCNNEREREGGGAETGRERETVLF